MSRTTDAHGPDRPGRPLVSLVGAGPGGADLITLRGARLITEADCVVYDRLCDRALLEHASPAAELIPVGKCKGAGPAQHEINAVLVDRARRGLRVVRLKGGDPFLYGRGSEEIDALAAAGFDVEVVPGVSSAFAAPALAGIPVTERGVAASVALVSGHRMGDGDAYDWPALARGVDTIVVLMGATTARTVARELLAAGLPHTRPVAVIHAAGAPGQRCAHLTLAELAVVGCPFPSPTVIVIGPTAARARVIASSATGLVSPCL
jgi:uroporphyrin-III C-methyltransferase